MTSNTPEVVDLEDEEAAPSQVEAEQLIDQFVEITKTNSAEAQQFLQENQWNLQQAVSVYFSANTDDVQVVPISLKVSEKKNISEEVVEKLFGEGKKLTSEPPPRLLLLSWNLDGLDERCLKKRMISVVGVVRKLEPDIIFFQEVIDEIAVYLERKLPEYKSLRGHSPDGYYNATFIRIFTVRYDSHTIVPFNDTGMGRHFVLTRAHVGARHFAFLNTHLESCAEFADKRKAQLKFTFAVVQSVPREVTVVIGGDLNLRDSEVGSIVPYEGWVDAWEACGSRSELRWTWDTRRNTNKGFGPSGPRARFDRLYIRTEPQKVRVQDFGLVGAQKAAQTQMFPSDHWGIFTCMNLKHS